MEHYKVVDELGRGTWGVVHKAIQQGTGRVVAIKVCDILVHRDQSLGCALSRYPGQALAARMPNILGEVSIRLLKPSFAFANHAWH
jgi:serine/threonine protein kinase